MEELKEENGVSYFDGHTAELIGYEILCAFITIISFGICLPWAVCMFARWETQHTVVNGRRLTFDGRGGELIWKWLLWVFLTIITFGIFGIWVGIKFKRWMVEHTHFVKAAEEEGVDGTPTVASIRPTYIGPEVREPGWFDKLIPVDSIREKLLPPLCGAATLALMLAVLFSAFG